MFNAGDIVTIRPPFGNSTDTFVVSNVLDSDTVQVWTGGEHVAYANHHLDFVATGGEYPVPVVDEQPWWITKGAFRSRFTLAEKIIIELAALDNPTAPIEQRKSAAAIRTAEKDADASQYIDLKDPRTIAGVTSYETYGLIGTGRAVEILTTVPTEQER